MKLSDKQKRALKRELRNTAITLIAAVILCSLTIWVATVQLSKFTDKF